MDKISTTNTTPVSYLQLLTDILSGREYAGKLFHLLKRECLSSCDSFIYIDKEMWNKWKHYFEETYTWDSSDRLEWNSPHYDAINESYLLHLTGGITVFYYKYLQSLSFYFDPASNKKVLEELKEQGQTLVKKKKSQFEIGYIHGEHGFLSVKFQVFIPYELHLSKYLGEEVCALKQEIISNINSKNSSGIYLLHGEAGTGKTSFIKEILSKVESKAIYLSPAYVQQLTSPQLFTLFMNHPGRVLIIEDTETVLIRRQADNSNAVSNLLNLTDGIPAD